MPLSLPNESVGAWAGLLLACDGIAKAGKRAYFERITASIGFRLSRSNGTSLIHTHLPTHIFSEYGLALLSNQLVFPSTSQGAPLHAFLRIIPIRQLMIAFR